MPKLKTHSGAKKRFKFTANGKMVSGQSGKSHFMRRRSKSQIRELRGTKVRDTGIAKRIARLFLPNHNH